MFARSLENLFETISQIAIYFLQWILRHRNLVFAIATLALAIAYILYLLLITHHGFWDFQGYVAALKEMESHGNPYNVSMIASNGDGLVQFIYAPIVAEAFYKISGIILTPVGLAALLGLSIVCTLMIPYFLADSPSSWHSVELFYLYGSLFCSLRIRRHKASRERKYTTYTVRNDCCVRS